MRVPKERAATGPNTDTHICSRLLHLLVSQRTAASRKLLLLLKSLGFNGTKSGLRTRSRRLSYGTSFCDGAQVPRLLGRRRRRGEACRSLRRV